MTHLFGAFTLTLGKQVEYTPQNYTAYFLTKRNYVVKKYSDLTTVCFLCVWRKENSIKKKKIACKKAKEVGLASKTEIRR